jgi:hypothetical protein
MKPILLLSAELEIFSRRRQVEGESMWCINLKDLFENWIQCDQNILS